MAMIFNPVFSESKGLLQKCYVHNSSPV